MASILSRPQCVKITTTMSQHIIIYPWHYTSVIFIITSLDNRMSSFQWAQGHYLTHWGRVTHICVSKLTIIGSDNGLSPGRHKAIIWTNAGILLIWPLGTNFNEILIEILTFSFMKMYLKVSSAKWRPFCLGLNVLNSVYKSTCAPQ